MSTKLVVFASGHNPHRPLVVSQRELIEERLASREAGAALRALGRVRRGIREKLELGASVEPGLHTAELLRRRRAPARGADFLCLVVR